METEMKKRTTNQLTNQRTNKPSDRDTAKQLIGQYRIVVESERSCFRERVKFGAMLIMWERFLGESRGGAVAGQRGTGAGEGLKGWLEDNCPEIGYDTAMKYKYSAERAIAMLGGGAMATAALLGHDEVTQPDGEVVDVDEATAKKCDELFEDATSRRKLEQMYFDFMGKEERKAKRGTVAPLPKVSRQEAARRIWAALMAQLDKRTALDAIALLPPADAKVCHDRLFELTKAMKAQMAVGD